MAELARNSRRVMVQPFDRPSFLMTILPVFPQLTTRSNPFFFAGRPLS